MRLVEIQIWILELFQLWILDLIQILIDRNLCLQVLAEETDAYILVLVLRLHKDQWKLGVGWKPYTLSYISILSVTNVHVTEQFAEYKSFDSGMVLGKPKLLLRSRCHQKWPESALFLASWVRPLPNVVQNWSPVGSSWTWPWSEQPGRV